MVWRLRPRASNRRGQPPAHLSQSKRPPASMQRREPTDTCRVEVVLSLSKEDADRLLKWTRFRTARERMPSVDVSTPTGLRARLRCYLFCGCSDREHPPDSMQWAGTRSGHGYEFSRENTNRVRMCVCVCVWPSSDALWCSCAIWPRRRHAMTGVARS